MSPTEAVFAESPQMVGASAARASRPTTISSELSPRGVFSEVRVRDREAITSP
jgi:hypothetical protein